MATTRPTGRLKGRFEIMEQIGEGGFATVYRAKESTTGKIVALKLLKDAYLKDVEVVERFRREVFAVASISSPYVVKMHDFGISGDEVFIAMEYVEGPTLREVMHERPWQRQRHPRHHRPDRAGARGRASAEHRAPRPQAGERHPRR